jgi:hypothetical protein
MLPISRRKFASTNSPAPIEQLSGQRARRRIGRFSRSCSSPPPGTSRRPLGRERSPQRTESKRLLGRSSVWRWASARRARKTRSPLHKRRRKPLPRRSRPVRPRTSSPLRPPRQSQRPRPWLPRLRLRLWLPRLRPWLLRLHQLPSPPHPWRRLPATRRPRRSHRPPPTRRRLPRPRRLRRLRPRHRQLRATRHLRRPPMRPRPTRQRRPPLPSLLRLRSC